MKTIIKMSAVLLVVFTFISCGPSYVAVSSRPTPPVYVRPVQPYPSYVWIDGDWYYRGGRYHYRNGYWAPPRAHYYYRPGTWQQRGNGYYWRRGRWHR